MKINYEEKYKALLKQYNSLAKILKQQELFPEETIIPTSQIPKNLEGWSISKRPSQKGFLAQKTICHVHFNVHIPETEDGGIEISVFRQITAHALAAKEQDIEEIQEERLRKRRLHNHHLTENAQKKERNLKGKRKTPMKMKNLPAGIGGTEPEPERKQGVSPAGGVSIQ